MLDTSMDGGLVDPAANGLPISSIGIERDGLRNNRLAITASFTDGEDSWAGTYVARVPEPHVLALFSLGLLGIAFLAHSARPAAAIRRPPRD